MKVRLSVLWKVPVLCVINGLISFYLTAYLGGFFFAVSRVGEDGVTQLSADPLRSTIFHLVLFLLLLFLGGRYVLHSMTRAEIAVSAGIATVLFGAVVVAQICVPDFPISVSVQLAMLQEWVSAPSSLFLAVTDHFNFSVLVSCFSPFLFVPFGKRGDDR